MTIEIVTEYVYPPIPVRHLDWAAHYDDPEGPREYGATEAEATVALRTSYPRDDAQ